MAKSKPKKSVVVTGISDLKSFLACVKKAGFDIGNGKKDPEDIFEEQFDISKGQPLGLVINSKNKRLGVTNIGYYNKFQEENYTSISLVDFLGFKADAVPSPDVPASSKTNAVENCKKAKDAETEAEAKAGGTPAPVTPDEDEDEGETDGEEIDIDKVADALSKMSKKELEAFIKENALDVSYKKKATLDEIRSAILDAIEGGGEEGDDKDGSE